MNTKLWIDDERKPTLDWDWARNYTDGLYLIATGDYVLVSMDHDLGDPNGNTGYDILCEVERQIAKGGWWVPLPEFIVHSANPVGRANMERAIAAIRRLADEVGI